jgi:hypothetical protein
MIFNGAYLNNLEEKNFIKFLVENYDSFSSLSKNERVYKNPDVKKKIGIVYNVPVTKLNL